MNTRITQPHTHAAPVVTDIRSAPTTQRELVIASLLARPDAHGRASTMSWTPRAGTLAPPGMRAQLDAGRDDCVSSMAGAHESGSDALARA
jgi:hypothetical protein